MSLFVDNPVDFSATCAQRNGRCHVARDNFLFLDNAQEIAAIDQLQIKCGQVVIIADRTVAGEAWLYLTSCQRMTDVVDHLFAGCLAAAERLPQGRAEQTVGELHRRRVSLSIDHCRRRVDGFDFAGTA